jgi:outer membrane protein OmpA-like peptidoglycan-associated protein
MNSRIFVLSALATALAACASIPERNSALDLAHSRFTSLQNDAQNSKSAPEEMQRAAESLRVADQAWTRKESASTVDHLAYLASQRVTIAQETASSRTSQAITAGAAAERDKMRLALRTREADTANQQLVVSQRSDAQKTAELAQAEASAASEKARMDLSKARVLDLESQLKELNAKQTERGMVVTLGDVLFDSGQSRLLPGGTRNMVKLADFFKRNPERSASIEGYTDSIGSDSANYLLSERRAGAVMSALVNLGVAADRLSTRAHGAEMPVADNGTSVGRQMNRRVEIVFAPQRTDGVN